MQGFGDDTVRAALDDPRHADIPEKLRAALVFLEKLTRHPKDVHGEDLEALHEIGIDDQGIVEMVDVCFVFIIHTRVADAMDYDLPLNKGFERGGRFLYNFGYEAGSLVRRVLLPEAVPNNDPDGLRPRVVRQLSARLVKERGVTPPELRAAVMERAQRLSLGETDVLRLGHPRLETYVDKFPHRAYEIQVADIIDLRDADYNEDEIFELTLSAALGAALARLDAGLRAHAEQLS